MTSNLIVAIIYDVADEKRGWRNWQTRRTKDPVTALGREGSSPSLRIVKDGISHLFLLLVIKNRDKLIFRFWKTLYRHQRLEFFWLLC